MLTLLAVTESFTRAEIQSRLDQQTLETLKGIFPKASFYVFEEDIYSIYDNGRREIGYAFYAEGWGYGGKMVILVGLEDKETIKGINVVSNYETPSYWDLVVDSNFFDQFIGLRIEDCYLKRYGGDDGQVDGITGATLSSQSVVDIVRETALEKVKDIR
jgi:electron transport complex protein RnfG